MNTDLEGRDDKADEAAILAAVKDLATMEIVGWSMAERLKSVLCEDALKMAIRSRRLPMGLIHHSDRGVQYACGDYRKLLRLHGIKASMSRKGNCLDNALWRASLGLSRPNSCTVPGFLPGARPRLRYSSTSRSSITNDGATRASATGRRHRPGGI